LTCSVECSECAVSVRNEGIRHCWQCCQSSSSKKKKKCISFHQVFHSKSVLNANRDCTRKDVHETKDNADPPTMKKKASKSLCLLILNCSISHSWAHNLYTVCSAVLSLVHSTSRYSNYNTGP